jgi:hypothetical protein
MPQSLTCALALSNLDKIQASLTASNVLPVVLWMLRRVHALVIPHHHLS